MGEEFPEWAEEVLPPKEGIPSFRDIFLGGAPEMRNLSDVQKFQGVRHGPCPLASCGGPTGLGDK